MLASKVKAVEPLMQQLSENRDNPQLLNQAQQQLAEILAIDPANQQGLNGMLNLSLWTNKPREAREWARKIVSGLSERKNGLLFACGYRLGCRVSRGHGRPETPLASGPMVLRFSPTLLPVPPCAISMAPPLTKESECWAAPSKSTLTTPTPWHT